MLKKRFPNYISFCVSLFAYIILTACSENPTDSKYISGSAVKGVISNGIIRVYSSKQDKQLIAESRTNQHGQFALELHTLDLPALYLSDAPLLVELSVDKDTRMRCDLTGGCTNHADGKLVNFGDNVQLPDSFKLFGLTYSNEINNLSYISPLSHLIVSTALKNNQDLTIDSVNIATKWVNDAFKLSVSPLQTQPKDITQLTNQPIMIDEQLKQSILSAALYPETLSPAWSLGHESIDTINLKSILSRAAELAGDLSTLIAKNNPNQASTLDRIQSDTETHLLTFDTPEITILSQPDAMTVTEQESFSLYVQANSDLELSYQWYKNDDAIPGANSAIYSNTSSQVSDSGLYHVLISNNTTEKRSLSASISVNQAEVILQITQQPQSQSISEGDPISLSVTSLGEGAIHYQWQRNGSLIPGANSSTYTIPNSQPQDAGTYRVVVSNEDKQLNSNFVNVWVKEIFHEITINQQPQAKTIQAGSTFTLSINASSDAPLSVQWYKNDQLIPGANSATYSKTSSQTSDTGLYHALISNNSTEQRSLSASISVTPAEYNLHITQQPLGQSVTEGDPISLSVTTQGEGTIRYQWQKNGSLIPGATSNTYIIPNSKTQDAGAYRVVTSNESKQLNSNFVNVLVTKAVHKITISQQPQAKAIHTGSTFTLSISASSDAPLSFQWYKNDQLIPGANSATYSKTSSQVNDTGLYHVLISNSSTEQRSLSASISVTPVEYTLQIAQQPQGQSVTEGDLVSLSVVSLGEGTIRYQWQKNGSLIPGATSSTYIIPNSQTQDAGAYRVVVSNESKQLNSNFVNVWVTEAILPITISQQPQTKVIPEGSSVELDVSADGGGFIRYQWRKNGLAIDNAFNRTLTLSNVSQLDSAIYDVIVSNSQGSVTSSPANLSVITNDIPITITHQPEPQTILPGTSFILSVSTSVEEDISYQWFLDGDPIDSANSANYQILSANIEDQGKYTALISNASSSELSEAAQVTIEQAKSNSIELTWDTPTEREDGSPLSANEIQGYVIEYGNNSIDLQHSVNVDNLLPNAYIINDLPLGTLFLRIATIDSDNKQGEFSQVINITLQ